MRGDIAGHHEPGMAARAVMPMLLVQPRRIVAQIDVVDPSIARSRLEALRPRDRGIAAIGELFERPLTAIGTFDPHGLRPQCRFGCAPMPFSSMTAPRGKRSRR